MINNLPSNIWIVYVATFFVGCFFFYWLFVRLWKQHEYYSKFNVARSKFIGCSMLGGIAFSLVFSYFISKFIPTVISIEEDNSYSVELSFIRNYKLVLGGFYIINYSNHYLYLKGIGSDVGINITINPKSVKKVQRCPDCYFEPMPNVQSVHYYRTKRGRIRVSKGPSLYLID